MIDFGPTWIDYTIEEELDYLFGEDHAGHRNPQYIYTGVTANSVYYAILEGRLRNTRDYPQYVDVQGNASFYGWLADLEPTKASVLSSTTSIDFGHRYDECTAIEAFTHDIQLGDTPETSPALAQLAQLLQPYLIGGK